MKIIVHVDDFTQKLHVWQSDYPTLTVRHVNVVPRSEDSRVIRDGQKFHIRPDGTCVD